MRIISQRAADGGIAAEKTGLNGLPRASGNVLAEYARRGCFTLIKQAYVCTHGVDTSSVKQGGTAGILSCPGRFDLCLGTGFLFVSKANILKKESLQMSENKIRV